MHDAPYLGNVFAHAVTVVYTERIDAIDGRVVYEKRCDAIVEHHVYGGFGEGVVKGVEQRSRHDGVSQLSESNDEYLHVLAFRIVFFICILSFGAIMPLSFVAV